MSYPSTPRRKQEKTYVLPEARRKRLLKKRRKTQRTPEGRRRKRAAIKKRAETKARTGIHGGRQLGQFDGYTPEESNAIWAAAELQAKEDMEKLIEAGVVDPNEEKANEALEAALTVMRTPGGARDTLQAARLVLDFTRAKPAAKSEVTVKTAEDWLAAVTKDAISSNES